MKNENGKLGFRDVSPKNIWNYRQNHPELVINDVVEYLRSEDFSVGHPLATKPLPFQVRNLAKALRASLMARGVNKWLKVRRDLIAYKKVVKNFLRDHLEVMKLSRKQSMTYEYIPMREVMSLVGAISHYEGYEQSEAIDRAVAALKKYVRYRDERERYITLRERCKDWQQIRHDLKKMCMTDRWQEWEGKKLEDMNSIKGSGN